MICKTIRFLLILLVFQLGFSQKKNEVANDSIAKERKWNFSVELASRYIWRGQSWGGNYAVVQPTIEYNLTDKLTIGTWATSNFKKEYFYPDETYYKGYHEWDLYLSYKVSKVITLELWDYYWPSVSKVDGVDNRYFNFGPNSVQSVDAFLILDFSEIWLPFNVTLNTLVGGNDYRLDENGENPKRNFTTYFEIGYAQELFEKIEIAAASGVVINNEAEYYTHADYDKPSLINLNVKTTYPIKITENLNTPIWLSYTYNAATANTEVFGKNFLVFGTTIEF